MAKMYCGCDIGSTYSKCVILDEDQKILSYATIRSKLDPGESAQAVIAEAASIITEIKGTINFAYVVGTGYGRTLVPNANENVSEISCHAMGVHTTNPDIRTIIDIGGQDVKSISIDKDGGVKNFGMNDKCAAGTGRFFEMMSRVFDMDLNQFSALSLKAKTALPITSQCSVFAETEVISLLAQKKSPADIAAGIQLSVAKRCYGLAKSVGLVEKVTVTGGCAKNFGLCKALEQVLKVKIVPLDFDPQLMGALGAAVLAHRKSNPKNRSVSNTSRANSL